MAIHPKLRVYREPARGSDYIIGADPAEGNPNSDASSLVVLDALTAEEVASLSERIEPGVFSTYVRDIAHAFNGAGVLVERNINHGHVVINNLRAFGDVKLLSGSDGAPGYQTTSKSKAALYSNAADTFKDGLTILHTESTYYQIGSIEGATLKAPQGEFDDEATAYVLALMALNAPDESSFVYSYLTAQQQAVDRRLAAVMSVR